MPRRVHAAPALLVVAAVLAAGGATWSQTVSPAFTATFRQPSGNDWWLQVHVDASEPLQRVDARVDGGAWRPLSLRSWGAWAASHHAPDGATVEFLAVARSGANVTSGCYRWTAAAPIACPTPPDPDHASFAHGGGNEWWVEAVVRPPPEALEAMDEGEPWRALRLRDWGEWAGSFHVEPGHRVRFRALYAGAWVESCWFAHPGGAPGECPAPPEPLPNATGMRRLLVLGDTGVTNQTRANVQAALAENVTGMIGTGDYYYSAPPLAWRTLFQPVLAQGAWLALGNHDRADALAPYLPSGATWSANVSGARVVGINSTRLMVEGSEQHAFARDALCNASEELRILVTHHGWWLGPEARHPGSEFPAAPETMDALVATCGVDLVLAGHEHNYQRLMRGDVAYVTVGTGGQSLYAVRGAPNGTVASAAAFGRVVLDLDATRYALRFRGLDNATLDAHNGTARAAFVGPPPTPSPTVTFAHRGGDEWWVEARVAPFPREVQAMDTGGAWKALTYRWWGNWAGSFHVEPGNEVRFRALVGGAWHESCWWSHPAGLPRECPPPDD